MALYILGPDANGVCCECADRPNPCDACEPSDCSCALLLPPFGAPYASYAVAAAVLADAAQVSACIGYCQHSPSDDPDNTFSASFNGTTLELDGRTEEGSLTPPGSTKVLHFYSSVSLKVGAIVSVAYVIGTDGTSRQNEVELLTCAGVQVAYDLSITSAGTLSVTVPEDGEYIIHIGSQGGPTTGDATYVTATNDVTCDMVFIVNPVIALWDDSGTTRQLEACPKLFLPPPNGDSWYVDEATAQAVLDDPLKVSNCVGYAENNPLTPFTSFSATGGGSLVFVAGGFGFFANTGNIWGSINALVGAIITATTDGNFIQIIVYDDNGDLVSTSSANPGTTTSSSALPYTGRYTVAVISARAPGGSSSITVSVTSSSSMTTNVVQAVYDHAAFDCPGRLDC